MIKNLAIVIAVAAIAAGVAHNAQGADGLRGALIGAGIVAVFFLLTPATLGVTTQGGHGASVMIALVFFFTKVVALFVVLALVTDTERGYGDHIHVRSLALTVIVSTMVWTALATVSAVRKREPIYQLPDPE